MMEVLVQTAAYLLFVLRNKKRNITTKLAITKQKKKMRTLKLYCGRVEVSENSNDISTLTTHVHRA